MSSLGGDKLIKLAADISHNDTVRLNVEDAVHLRSILSLLLVRLKLLHTTADTPAQARAVVSIHVHTHANIGNHPYKEFE